MSTDTSATTDTSELAEAPEQVLAIAQAIIQGPAFEATFRVLGESFAEQLALASLRGYQAALALRTPSDGVTDEASDAEMHRQATNLVKMLAEWFKVEPTETVMNGAADVTYARLKRLSALTPGKE